MSTLAAELDTPLPYETSNLLEVKKGTHSKELQYWKLCADEACKIHTQQKGWVVTGPALSPKTAVEWSQFMETKHAVSLASYGKWATGTIFKAETRFANLIENGGLHEIPLEQAAAYKWHLNPRMVKLFPGIENTPVLKCEHGCPDRGLRMRTFNSVESQMKHYRAMHQDVVAPTLIGKQLKEATQSPFAAIPPEYWAAVVAAIREASLPESATSQPVIRGGSDD